MSASVEALYIFDEQNNCILEHIYASRPPSSQDLIRRLQAHPNPRPSILHLNDLSPPTTTYLISHANLLFICTSSRDAQSLAVLEFLYRVVDVFEDFLGSPLLGSKIEDNYEVVAQLLGEMCDGGVICNTESNALREQVEMSTLMGKLFTQVGLPGSSPALGPSSNLAATLKASSSTASGPAIPWRRPNVKHTSNELYVDLVENLSVIYAPSGRPISARVAGSIVFTAKISGIPELLLTLSAPGGTSSIKSAGISRTMELPVFHPCVRLARWKEAPGELSFVPPDGRFMLAGYETNLLPFSLNNDEPPSRSERIFLPATVDLRTGLGTTSSDFEARVTLNTNFPGVPSAPKPGPSSRSTSTATPFSFGGASGAGAGSSSAPTLEGVVVSIPFPSDVRTVLELKPSRGEANYNTITKTVEWKIPTKDGATVNGVATLTGSVAGSLNTSTDNDMDVNAQTQANSNSLAGYYDDDTATHDPDQQTQPQYENGNNTTTTNTAKRTQANKALMPRSIAVSFSVKGWLASGIKVESLNVDVKKSKGLGDGVKPYKGVKYLTVSKLGVERRVS